MVHICTRRIHDHPALGNPHQPLRLRASHALSEALHPYSCDDLPCGHSHRTYRRRFLLRMDDENSRSRDPSSESEPEDLRLAHARAPAVEHESTRAHCCFSYQGFPLAGIQEYPERARRSHPHDDRGNSCWSRESSFDPDRWAFRDSQSYPYIPVLGDDTPRDVSLYAFRIFRFISHGPKATESESRLRIGSHPVQTKERLPFGGRFSFLLFCIQIFFRYHLCIIFWKISYARYSWIQLISRSVWRKNLWKQRRTSAFSRKQKTRRYPLVCRKCHYRALMRWDDAFGYSCVS